MSHLFISLPSADLATDRRACEKTFDSASIGIFVVVCEMTISIWGFDYTFTDCNFRQAFDLLEIYCQRDGIQVIVWTSMCCFKTRKKNSLWNYSQTHIICVCIYVCMYVCVYIYIYIYIYIYTCMYVCMYIYIYTYKLCVYVFICVCMCLLIYIYIYRERERYTHAHMCIYSENQQWGARQVEM